MDGDEPAGDWATSHDSVHYVLVDKKSNAMLVFILFSTEENLVSVLYCARNINCKFCFLDSCLDSCLL